MPGFLGSPPEMLNMTARTVLCVALCGGSFFWEPAARAESGNDTMVAATEVLQDLLNLTLHEIPAALLNEAHAVAIIPNTIKVGLVVGGQLGNGVLVVRDRDGTWRAPTFISMTGASIGVQAGAQGSDIVLVFKTQKSVEGLLQGSFKIGADVSAAAGPIGRRAEAATDTQLRAEVYSYARSRGLFAGVSLDGSVIQVDREADRAYYGTVAQGEEIPPAAQKVVDLIARAAAHPAEPLDMPVLAPGDSPTPPAAAEAERLKQQLSRAAAALNAKLNPAWRQYLAIPAEPYGDGNHPALDELKRAQSRFDTVQGDSRYQGLTQLREFQATGNLLRAYVRTLSSLDPPKLNLPPPPTGDDQ